MNKNITQTQIKNQLGFAPLILLMVALIILGIIFVVVYFIFQKDPVTQPKEAAVIETEGIQNQDLPYQVCVSGDERSCNDPITPSETDNIKIEEGS